ncbi:IDEAL domain-containing protein [Bacillus sp. CGMCC 1.16541]|uniref:IDEAL domain-containing protein n=1 Tax=Bacillus sp. CGMCC 1.16541 TaxID=2185143 RepID=UPI000D73186F|nr:IDEAL domain-containing protein [Bacillus sp. CGMCC 1.16541]
MKNEKSYTEMMKSLARKKRTMETISMLDVYIDMIIDESLFKRRKELLEQSIDEALDNRDQQTFRDLAKQYQLLVQSAT